MNSCLKQAGGNIRKMCRSVRTILMKTVRPIRSNILTRDRQNRLNRARPRADQNRTGTAFPARLLKINRSVNSKASRIIGKKEIHPAADADNGSVFQQKTFINKKGQPEKIRCPLCNF